MLINKDLRVANISKSKRQRSQASEALASTSTGAARSYRAAVPPSTSFVRSTQARGQEVWPRGVPSFLPRGVRRWLLLLAVFYSPKK
jgi:hypothetical protein